MYIALFCIVEKVFVPPVKLKFVNQEKVANLGGNCEIITTSN